ncbi:MAG: urease accessory protein, partial [Gammaproteobacteria bacterium]
VRALLVGMMHGMAGSAALILLTLKTVVSPGVGLLYIVLFGLGSILGMALLSVVIAIPLRHSESGLTRAHNILVISVGLATVALGEAMIYEVGAVQGFLP